MGIPLTSEQLAWLRGKVASGQFSSIEDAAAENVWYMEVRYAPILSTKRGLSPRQVVDAIKRGLARGMELHPRIQAYQIICGLRHFEPERALRMAALAVEYKDRGVVAFDLAGAEADNPAKWFREAFYIVRDANLNVTVHAGEAYGPDLAVCGRKMQELGAVMEPHGKALARTARARSVLRASVTKGFETGIEGDTGAGDLRPA